MRLVQFRALDGARKVGLVSEDGLSLQVLRETSCTYELAMEASQSTLGLESLARERLTEDRVDYGRVVCENRILPPLDHPDPAHCLVSGTGLDHLGSALARDAMHAETSTLTDSMRMFKMGLEGGKPNKGHIGAQPEWFYKGDGDCIVSPGHPLRLPPFALDGGEEAEIVGLYVVAESGAVLRVGFALGNEFSDHILERQNCLYLAHSKLRDCSIGPELLIGQLPESISGLVRLLRGDIEVWASTFLTGEANMSHSIANIEHHHFKYQRFRRPGDVHCHFLGAAVISFSSGVAARPGDVFEIWAPQFGRPLRNTLVGEAEGAPVAVQML